MDCNTPSADEAHKREGPGQVLHFAFSRQHSADDRRVVGRTAIDELVKARGVLRQRGQTVGEEYEHNVRRAGGLDLVLAPVAVP